MLGSARSSVRVLSVFVGVGLMGAVVLSGSAPSRAILDRIARDSLAAQRFVDRGHADSADVVLDGLARDLRLAGDEVRWARARLVASDVTPRLRQPDSMLAIAAQASAIGRARRDTSVWIRSLRLEARGSIGLGDLARGAELAREMERLARLQGSMRDLGIALAGRGWVAWQQGELDPAERFLRSGVALVEREGDRYSTARFTNSLGNVLADQGRLDEAAPLLSHAARLSEAIGDVAGLLHAQHDLGRVELRRGNPEQFVHVTRRNAEAFGRRGEWREQIMAYANIAQIAIELGRLDETERLLRDAMAIADRHGVLEHRPRLLLAYGWVFAQRGQTEGAKQIWRGLLTAEDQGEGATRQGVATALGEALASEDSLVAAEAVMGVELRRAGRLSDYATHLELEFAYAEVLRRLGRTADACSMLKRAASEAASAGDDERTFAAYSFLARAERVRGDRVAAARATEHATAVWEALRGRLRDLEYRSARGEQAQLLMQECMLAALATAPSPARAAAAFDRQQRFRTRTLLERISAPHRNTADTVAALGSDWIGTRPFQRDVLRQGECLLEYAVGPDTTLLFAITRDSVKVFGLPPVRAFAAELDSARVRMSAARGPEPTHLAEELGRALGARLLAPAAVEIARSRALIVAPDGPLHRVAFEALFVPEGREPLGVSAQLTQTPSAGVLAAIRRSATPPSPGLLAVLGGARSSERRLSGARREVGELARRFAPVRAIVPGPDGCTPLTTAGLASAAMLHFAGHVRVRDDLPWRSGLVLGRAAEGGDSLLTADALAMGRVSAQLVVLSGCESAGGLSRAGEGLEGLSAAFLAAGARAVVASKWPVEDGITALFMARFYDGLANGASAANALQEARAWLRARPDTRAPGAWAAFTLIGDDPGSLPLRRNAGVSSRARLLLAGAFAALALGVGVWGWRRVMRARGD